MNIDKLIERVKGILLTPSSEWNVIAGETTTVADLYKNYIVVLAAIPAVFGFIKGSVIGVDVPLMGTVRVGIGTGLTAMLVGYALSLVQVYVIAWIVDALAPTFGAQKNLLRALMLAAYAFTAAWVAGLGQILPWIGALVALAGGVYSIYLLYLGLPALMRCPPDKALGYTVVTVVISFVLSIAAALVVGSITGGTTPGQVGSSDIDYDKDSAIGKLEEWNQKMEQASQEVEASQKSGDAAAQGEAIGRMLGTALGSGEVEALAPDRLKSFIPDSLADLPRTESSAERNGAMGMQVSEARATFADDAGRSLTLEIVDMGSAKGLLALAGFASLEEEQQTDSGYSKTYNDDGRLVHEKWDSAGHGEFAVVVGERFTVKVTGDADELDELKEALNEVDLASLESMKNEGVQED